MLPEDQRFDLDRYLRVMLVENIETDRRAITETLQGTIRHLEVKAVDYGASTSDTMSGTLHCDVAILDWDTAPDAAAGLIHILKIKRPTLLVVCLTERWNPRTAVQILEAGADYHLVKEAHFTSVLPLVLAQWTRRDHAVALDQVTKDRESTGVAWPDSLDALGEPLVLVAADLAIVQANQAAMKLFRRGEDEVIGRPFSAVFYGSDQPPGACPVVKALQLGQPASEDVPQSAAGIALSVRAWPIFTQAGKISSAVVLMQETVAATRLKTREWLYRSLTEKANAGIAMVGTDGRLGYVNQRFCAMLDRSEHELLGSAIETLVSSQEQDKLRQCLQDAVERGESADRIVLQRSDGSASPAEVRLAAFASHEGPRLVVTAIGVKELEQAEQELWNEARRFSLVLDEGVDKFECGVVVLDVEGRVSWVNALGAGLFTADKQALIGRPYVQIVRNNLRSKLRNGPAFVEALGDAHNKGHAIEGFAIYPTDGSKPLSYYSTPIHGGAGSTVSRVEHFYPTVAVAGPLAGVPAGQEGLAALASVLPEMLFSADAQGRLTWCNPASVGVTGYREDRLRMLMLPQIAAEEGRRIMEELIARAVRRVGQPVREEVLLARSDGRRYWGEVSLLCLESRKSGLSLHGSIRDVTDRRLAQAIRDLVTGQRPV